MGVYQFPIPDPDITQQMMANQQSAFLSFCSDPSAPVWNALPNATTPLQLLTGREDSVCPPTNAYAVSAQYANGDPGIVSLVEFPLSGHGVQFTYLAR